MKKLFQFYVFIFFLIVGVSPIQASEISEGSMRQETQIHIVLNEEEECYMRRLAFEAYGAGYSLFQAYEKYNILPKGSAMGILISMQDVTNLDFNLGDASTFKESLEQVVRAKSTESLMNDVNMLLNKYTEYQPKVRQECEDQKSLADLFDASVDLSLLTESRRIFISVCSKLDSFIKQKSAEADAFASPAPAPAPTIEQMCVATSRASAVSQDARGVRGRRAP